MTQKESNPYKYSDTNKRYYTYDYYLKQRFGAKCAKISLDAGFTCPNIDGKVGLGGCIYCSGGSSGAQCGGDITSQYIEGVTVAKKKWKCNKFIPYLQAHTNTYADIDTLRRVYGEVLNLEDAVMLAIATRADCLDGDVLELLLEVSKRIPLQIELGLQTSNDGTAQRIGRGHDFDTFVKGYNSLKNIGGDIEICVHLIDGLPGETETDMINSARDVAKLRPDMVKIHLLHVLKNTKLEAAYRNGEYVPMTMEQYSDIAVRQLEILPPDMVIARITGDAPLSELVAPAWSRQKTALFNRIDRLLYDRNTWQGRLYDNTEKE